MKTRKVLRVWNPYGEVTEQGNHYLQSRNSGVHCSFLYGFCSLKESRLFY